MEKNNEQVIYFIIQKLRQKGYYTKSHILRWVSDNLPILFERYEKQIIEVLDGYSNQYRN